MHLPSTSLKCSGFRARRYAPKKNAAENAARSATVPNGESDSLSVKNANMEYDVDAVRGMASIGPMQRNTAIVNAAAKYLWTLAKMRSVPPTFATATTPKTGKQTAVRSIPRYAGSALTPAL